MDIKTLQTTAAHALTGHGAHAATHDIFSSVDWKMAGRVPAGASHSLYQLAGHMAFWQDWAVQWLDGEDPATPAHAAGSWPTKAAPTGAAEWRRALNKFTQSLKELQKRSAKGDLFLRHGEKSELEMLHAIAAHNSYHAGQVALLRQMLGVWPPPKGGLTW